MSAMAMAVAVTVETLAIWTASSLGGAGLLGVGILLRNRFTCTQASPYQSMQKLTIVFRISPGDACQCVANARHLTVHRLQPLLDEGSPCQTRRPRLLLCFAHGGMTCLSG